MGAPRRPAVARRNPVESCEYSARIHFSGGAESLYGHWHDAQAAEMPELGAEYAT
jgi:hypothetical protein